MSRRKGINTIAYKLGDVAKSEIVTTSSFKLLKENKNKN